MVGTLNQAGNELTLFCVNRDLTRDLPTEIAVDGFQPKGVAKVEVLSSASIYDTNDEVRPQAVVPRQTTLPLTTGLLQYTFRHESVTRIVLHR